MNYSRHNRYGKIARKNIISAVFIGFLGITVFTYLSFTLNRYPLFDFAVNDIDWTREWLYMTILDYYGAAISLSVIVIHTEGILYGSIWTLLFCLLGSPFCCIYIIYRLLYKSVVLKEEKTEEIEEQFSILSSEAV